MSIRDRVGWLREERYSLLTIGKVVIVLVLFVEVSLLVILQQRTQDEQAGNPSVDGISQENRSQHANEQGGFSFRVPKDWTVTDQGLISQLVNPGESLAMTVARLPGIQEPQAEQHLIAALKRDYRQVELRERRFASGVLDDTTRQVRGQASNATGLRVRFVAELPRVKGDLYAFVVFSDPGRTGTLLSPVRSVQQSFTLL